MDISQYEVIISKHAVIRALERGVDIDTLEDIVLNCKKKSFGKHHAKWVKKYDNIEIVCIGYIDKNIIKILTVETR